MKKLFEAVRAFFRQSTLVSLLPHHQTPCSIFGQDLAELIGPGELNLKGAIATLRHSNPEVGHLIHQLADMKRNGVFAVTALDLDTAILESGSDVEGFLKQLRALITVGTVQEKTDIIVGETLSSPPSAAAEAA